MAMDMDPHILNFYEDVDLKISDVPLIIDAALSGQLEDPREKLDGQNFTFTVKGGVVRFMGKGCPKWIRARGGLSRDEMRHHYESKPQVQSAFTGAFDILSHAVERADPKLVAALFDDGNSVVAAEVVTPINQNVVRYKRNAVCLIGVHTLGSKLGPTSTPDHFLRFQKSAQDIGSTDGWTIMGVPSVAFKPKPETQELSTLLKKEFMGLVPPGSVTMGDVLTAYVKKGLLDKNVPLSLAQVNRAARRLAQDDPSIMPRNDFTKQAWDAFKPIDDERAMFVGEWIAPIESFFRKLGSHAIEAHEFVLADVDDAERITELRAFVGKVKYALKNGKVKASTPEILRRIESASKRVDETMFTRNVEGIVFAWQGKLRKLTGAFTALNRLHGYFSFENAAQILD